jgi:hypothetical protein
MRPMIELNGVRIWAIPYRERRALAPLKLFCGAIVKTPTEAQRSLAPRDLPARIKMPGNPDVSIRFSGLFLLPTGDVAAVYGAVTEPLG